MENNDMKKCPYCAEMIKEAAVKCRYCGSTLTGKDTVQGASPKRNYWRRVNEGKRIAGVCTGLAREFDSPKLILPFRLFFVLTTVFYGFGFICYIVLWLLMSESVDSSGKPISEKYRDTPVESIQSDAVYHKKTSASDVLLGFLLLAAGAILILAPVSRGKFMGWPFQFNIGLPGFIHDALYFNINWFTTLLPVLILIGLILLFFGALKFLRIFLGCGLIAIGALFLIMFMPILPHVLFFPGLVIIGVILLLIGGLKLVFGTSSVVREEPAVQESAQPQTAVTDEDWNPHEE